jgi:hypothetical protein
MHSPESYDEYARDHLPYFPLRGMVEYEAGAARAANPFLSLTSLLHASTHAPSHNSNGKTSSSSSSTPAAVAVRAV